MAEVITAPEELSGIRKPAIFLAGGITGCSDWQSEAIRRLSDLDAVLLNPRRELFDVFDPSMEYEQIRWEHQALRYARFLLFWFPAPTDCPITLFEYGYWLAKGKPLCVATHPQYSRRRDVQIQTELVNPSLRVGASFQGLIEATRAKFLEYTATDAKS